MNLRFEGKFDEASALYESLHARAPRDAHVLYESGLCLLSMGKTADAEARFRESVEIAPQAPPAHVMLGLALKTRGRLHDAIAAFDRALEFDPQYFQAWMERGLAFGALDRVNDAIASFDKAIAIEPTSLTAIGHRGDALRRAGQIDQALACFDHVLTSDPDDTVALLGRGAALSNVRRNAEALECIEPVLSLQPHNVHALNNRGNVLVNLHRYEEAIQSFERVLELDPTYIAAWINIANVLATLNRYDDAKAASDRALTLGPESPAAHWNAALIDLRAGRYDSGWERYEVRWLMTGFGAPKHRNIKQWLGKDDLKGKRIVLWHEQGLGDTIQFCRYAIMVAALGASVVLEVQPALKPLIAESFKGVAQVIGTGEAGPFCDYSTSLMSLPLAFETRAESIPFAPRYLKANPARVQAWSERLGPSQGKLRIGLACTGNPKHKGDLERSIDLGMLASISRYGELYIVQKDARQGDRATLAARPEIVHFGDALTDFGETAALVENLDVVISVDTSLAHLAGALGKPVWILLPTHADWRWQLERDDSPWYPSARLFRQRTAGAWDEVVARVCEALEGLKR
ncbi:tetratricopeptide repeat protein [Pararobbsia alpina]|uniref:tetratricopeptide repeat protein n=1 Tax=Pararobbsia alpina TaxID=621374 RepID=UPI0039A4E613